MENTQNRCPQCGKSVPNGSNFCIKCGAAQGTDLRSRNNLERKRNIVLNKSARSGRVPGKHLFWVFLILLAGGWVYSNLSVKENPIIASQPVIAGPTKYPETARGMAMTRSMVADGFVTVPLDEIKQKKFVAFEYTAGAVSVPLLAYVSGAGKLITAVRMCEPCNSERFHIQGEMIVCDACGTTWNLDDLTAVSGACGKYPPDVIPSVVKDSTVQIDESLISRWQRRI